MIIIHKNEEFKKMRKAGKMAARLLNELQDFTSAGKTTQDLDDYAMDFCKKHKVKSACLEYTGGGKIPFPAYICTSLNHVICHGIPDETELKDGDIIGIDVTLIVDGYHGDTCRTFGIGSYMLDKTKKLLITTKKAMEIGIAESIAGNHIGDIGAAIKRFVTKQSVKDKLTYDIVEDYCGHGIGRHFHAPPQVPAASIAKTGPKIKEGMFFTVEPMINLGSQEPRLLKDGWTVIAKDYSLSAQFEHTIGIGPNGPEIFTIAE